MFDKLYHLKETKHQVQFTDIVKVLVEDLNKVVNSLEIIEVIVIHVDTDAEVQPCVAPVDNLKVSELHKVCMFGISYCHN